MSGDRIDFAKVQVRARFALLALAMGFAGFVAGGLLAYRLQPALLAVAGVLPNAYVRGVAISALVDLPYIAVCLAIAFFVGRFAEVPPRAFAIAQLAVTYGFELLAELWLVGQAGRWASLSALILRVPLAYGAYRAAKWLLAPRPLAPPPRPAPSPAERD